LEIGNQIMEVPTHLLQRPGNFRTQAGQGPYPE
jgi:hypothetical protein